MCPAEADRGRPARDVIRVREATPLVRYQLVTSLVVPRPIGWLSTRSADGTPNLAPYSFFAAVAATPMLVAVSIGHRRTGPKDTLENLRARGAFCVNVVTDRHLEAMNASSGDYPPEVDEFAVVGLELAEAETVDAPYVADCPGVLECAVRQEVALEGAASTLVIAEVLGIRLDPALDRVEGTASVDPRSLRPVGRLWGGAYALPGDVRVLPRPEV